MKHLVDWLSFPLFLLTIGIFCTPCDGPTYFNRIMEKVLADQKDPAP